MATDSLKRLYWDASVFLCFLSEEEEERREICEDILQHASDGKVELITSMYTLVEVIRPKAIKWPAPLTDAQVAKLEGMFKWAWIKKIQVHEELALAAVRLAREKGLKPADAIHTATAIQERADELQRWDYDFNKVASLIAVTEPSYLSQRPLLNVRRPIGPTPSDFRPTISPASSESGPLSAQSPGDGKVTTAARAPVLPASPPNVQAPPQPGSSPTSAPPPRSEK